MIQPKVILDYSSCVNRKANHDLERCMKSQKHMFFFLEFFCSFFSSSMSLVSLGNVSLNIIKMFLGIYRYILFPRKFVYIWRNSKGTFLDRLRRKSCLGESE